MFLFEKKKNPTHVPLAQNFLRRLKTIKHPNIISFVDGIENDEQILIITEKIITLNSHFSKLKEYPKAISWGIHQISVSISFFFFPH